jgi:thiol-disulfide isomerase/thioredoxin
MYSPFMIMFCFVSAAGAQTTLTGTLTGYDGNPMKQAHVHLVKIGEFNDSGTFERPFLRVAADNGGRYRLTTDVKGPFFIQYSGVHHRDVRVLLATDQPVEEVIDVRLAAERFDEPILAVSILSDANGFARKEAKEMTRRADGTFAIVFPATADRFHYQLLLNGHHRNSGTQAQDYQHVVNLIALGEGMFYSGYRSVVSPGGAEVAITFDPELLARSLEPANVSFGNPSSPLATAARLYDEQRIYRTARTGAIDALIADGVAEAAQVYDVSAGMHRLPARYTSTDPLVRQLLPLTQLYLATWNVPHDSTLVADAVDRVLAAQIDPGSFVLTIDSRHAAAIYDVLIDDNVDDEALKERCERFVHAFLEQQTDHARTKLLSYILQLAADRYDEQARRKWYSVYEEQLGASDEDTVRFIFERFSKEITLAPGTKAPVFSLVSMEDPAVTYTVGSFKGKKVLVDFWAVWCGPCVEELPGLHAMYERYKAKGLEVLSVSFDKQPQDVTKFRATKWQMPWHHAFVEDGLASDIAKRFQVAGIPKPILIDGDTGQILALSSSLRGERLEKTLERVFN